MPKASEKEPPTKFPPTARVREVAAQIKVPPPKKQPPLVKHVAEVWASTFCEFCAGPLNDRKCTDFMSAAHRVFVKTKFAAFFVVFEWRTCTLLCYGFGVYVLICEFCFWCGSFAKACVCVSVCNLCVCLPRCGVCLCKYARVSCANTDSDSARPVDPGTLA